MSYEALDKRDGTSKRNLKGCKAAPLPTPILLGNSLPLRLPDRGLRGPQRSCTCAPCTELTSPGTCCSKRAAPAAPSLAACRRRSSGPGGLSRGSPLVLVVVAWCLPSSPPPQPPGQWLPPSLSGPKVQLWTYAASSHSRTVWLQP